LKIFLNKVVAMKTNPNEMIRFIESLAANAWRPAVEQHLDGWRLRVTGGSSSRVNSVWPNHLSGNLSLEERFVLVEDFYRRHGQPACFHMNSAVLPENLLVELHSRGYQDLKPTVVKIAPVEVVLAKSIAPKLPVTQSEKFNEEWFHTYTSASEYHIKSLPIRHGILSRIGPEANFLLLKKNNKPVAVGLGVVERGWLGVFCVVTYKSHRRQNFASQVMHSLTSWGIEAGARQIYLQVMENNPPALALYHKLGFRKLYDYWYTQRMLE
jgi:GNAT superfamily N-acetyltransferase